MIRLRHLLRSRVRPSLLNTGPQTITAPPTVRRVRFRRPWLRSFIGKFLLYGAAFHIWSSFVLIRFDDDTTDDDESPREAINTAEDNSNQPLHRNETGQDDEEKDDDPLFIPLSWSRVQEGELYSASDPEWQEFVKISKDRKQLQKLRDELASIALQNASSQMSQILGGPLSLTGFWLVHQFPHRAPPGYVRSGLEFTDNGTSWVTKTMDPDMGDRLQTFMKPVHVALAIKDAYFVLLKRQLDRLRNPNGQPDAVELLNGKYILSSHERTNPMSTHEQPKLQPDVSDDPLETMSSSDDPELHPSSIISSLQRLPLPDLGPGSDLHLASIAFKLRLHEHRAQSPRTPCRGSFFISGPVGIKGPNGFCRFEVRGEYDPAKPGWRTVDMKLKDLNLRRQAPLGRP